MATGTTWRWAGALGRLAAAVLLAALPGFFAATDNALAQAGSVGGVVGKTGKSQSGSDEAPSAAPDSRTRREPRPARAAPTSSCGKMPGNWAWFNGVTAVISADGTAKAGAHTATWTCSNDSVVMHWSHGYTDRLRLSQDGTHLEGTNGFITVTGNKR
ncbi:hypothetical protein [Bradyrhizobium sp.]|uniref:hypothetical protein n=1 Tax=Bradyrhizobium sp. TaxID=376 RepID=UPI0023939EC5|nr:hypothetical protein [Bradyrhizobium sp.]MDE2379277.1 hypothetical protein [Bradyrhizobium sp.]